MGYAFISYSSKNQALADAMRTLLKEHNIDTWMAPYDIPAGSEYAEVLCDALSGCSCLVLMLTDVSQNSKWVKKEVNLAISNGKTIIPVKLEDIELNSTMKFYLNDQQIIPVHIIEDTSDEIHNVLDSVIKLTGQNVSKTVTVDMPQRSVKAVNTDDGHNRLKKKVVDIAIFFKFINVGYQLGRLEFLSSVPDVYKRVLSEIKICLDEENVPYDENNYSRFTDSILNYYATFDIEKEYLILLGIFLIRLCLSINVSDNANKQELYDLAISALKMIPSSFLGDKTRLTKLVEEDFKSNMDFIDILDHIYSYIAG